MKIWVGLKSKNQFLKTEKKLKNFKTRKLGKIIKTGK